MTATPTKQNSPDTVSGEWLVLGAVDPHDVHKGVPRHIGLSKDRLHFALLVQVGQKWTVNAGPWSYETLLRCAENIAAGDQRAITWPDAQLCMAAGYLALYLESEHRRRAAGAEEA